MYFMNRLCLFIYYNKTHVLYVNDNLKIRELISLISKKIEIPEYIFYMVCNAKIIDTLENYNENITIRQYNLKYQAINNEATIFIHTHSHSVPFYKRLIHFINKNGYEIDKINHNEYKFMLEISKIK